MKAGCLLTGMMFWMAAASARAENLPAGLAGLDVGMKGTGRVGGLSPRSEGPIAAPSIPDRQARPYAPTAAASRVRRDDEVVPARAAGISELEYAQTQGPVANCRIEVARRRRVAPAQVSAGSVVLRFTVEPSGRVHDAEAVSAINTDLDVAACAKRVLSEWTFAKHAAGNINVERVYRLDLRSMGRADRSLLAVSQ